MASAKQLAEIVAKTNPTPEEIAEIAKWLKNVGGCPHLHKWHNPGYDDSLMKCLDCGEENV